MGIAGTAFASLGGCPRPRRCKEAPVQTIEISRKDWAETLDAFTLMHEGWLVSVDVLSPDIGAQPAILNLPLLGLTADPVDRGDTVSISVARSAVDHVTHVVRAPNRMWIERTDEGADTALEIEAVDGSKTILRFTTVARVETVDGIAT